MDHSRITYPPGPELLSVEQMSLADRYAIDHGTSGERLMEAAGAGVVAAIEARWSPRSVVVLCGPGNNGGDGFVAARLLADAGWPVRVALLGKLEALNGEARANADRWTGAVMPLEPAALDGAELVIDALFGAGLTRDLEGVVKETIQRVNDMRVPCVGVDVPSGVDGDSGAIRGAAPRCALTVTFFRPKPGHVLLPGRLACGDVEIVDIGIPEAALDAIAPDIWVNRPALWCDHIRWPRLSDNKYRRGHAVVMAGAQMTGAGRLAARGALRVGAGLVSVTCAADAFPIYAAALTAGIIVHPLRGRDDFAAFLADPRKTAVLLGPGNGVDLATRTKVMAALATAKACVLDADALSVFADAPDELFGAIRGDVVFTPHDGEYERLFSHEGDRLTRARAAAAEAGAVIVLKGADTVVASPDGRACIADNAPADLATAGAGDVLAGIIAGLLAQGLPPWTAAAAGVWLHAEAADVVGPGLIADDLPDALPDVLDRLKTALGGQSAGNIG